MPLSRLENFLKNAEGNILYVNPSDFDATDGFENQGNSLTRPFKTIQRALIEAARFSYQNGRNNDKIDRTTILVYPGIHYVDNRPGYSIENISGNAVYKQRTGASTWTETFLNEFGRTTNYDILDPNNDLYKFNSVNGGVILPRGTSIIGLDLRKTKVRPLYVPDPYDNTVERSSIFNVTGTCYFCQFTFFDADITRTVYKDYTSNRYVPNFSHHKLVSFAYGDGVNKVALGNHQTDLTDLDMYYFKVAKAYGDLTGRSISDYPENSDFEPNIDEFRIVGTLQANPLGISSITYGDGVTIPSNVITITTSDLKTGETKPHDLFVDSPFYINGVEKDQSVYNGSFTVKEIVGLTTFRYIANSSPTGSLAGDDFSSATVTLESDTVSSASPYVFNCSIRSVYGLCGMWADGSKADGFKSMVVAQFTGVSLQKDDNAFMIYEDGNYKDNTLLSTNSPERPLHSNPKAKHKPDYESFHIRVSNNGFVQCVSIFAIGFGKHFVTESGGDMSITNSNSNFGSVSLESVGFRDESFDRDDSGYITHIIPPRELTNDQNDISWLSLDTQKIVSAATTSRLYLKSYTDKDIPPTEQVDGYRIGAKNGDILNLTLTVNNKQVNYTSPILMTVPSGTGLSARKEYNISRLGSLNAIDANGIISLDQNHQLYTGETIRIFSENGIAPDNIECDKIYYVITSSVNNSLSSNQIQLSYSFNDAVNGIEISNINNNGGILKIVSSVSDKIPGELGHPIQYDDNQSNWYIVGSATTASNKIYSGITTIGVSGIGEETPPTFITRTLDNRSIDDRIYKIRYVVPKEFLFARAPQPGFIIQESKTVAPSLISFNDNESINANTPPEYLRNEKIIVSATAGAISAGAQQVTVTTEKPHNFIVGDKVRVKKIKSTSNPTGVGITGTYNGSYKITSIPNSRQFTYTLTGVKIDPGTFSNLINERDTRVEREDLPLVSREEMKNTLYIYRVNTIRKHIPGATGQDGIYHIIALASNVSPSEEVNYNLSDKKFNQDVRNLYPQIDRDNYNYDPQSSVSSSYIPIIGKVVTNDKKKSITKEAIDYFLKNTRIGIAITGFSATGTGNTTITIHSEIEHGFNSVLNLNIDTPGAGYGNTTIYSSSLTGGSGSGAVAKITLSSGVVSTVKIVNGGSGYVVGDQLTVSAPTGITPSQNAIVSVARINDNVDDGIQLGGFLDNTYNDTFRILSIPSTKSIQIYGPTYANVPTVTSSSNPQPYFIHSYDNVGITSIKYADVSTGIVTVTTNKVHGLTVGNKISMVGTGHTIYNSSFIVRNVVSSTSFDFYIGITTESKSSTTGFVYKKALASNAYSLGTGEDNLSSRGCYIYAGISTTLSSGITTTSTSIQLTSSSGFNRGEYILINNEILRLASSPTGNSFTVLRGQFGTYSSFADNGTLVKKIRVIPSELRRPSFMRASGHTFEYLGYGPGNYSTGMPQKQSTVLTEDEVITSQARKMSGGIVVYSAMNDLGEFYSGSKKLSATTGEETVIEAPIITYTGDDARSDQTKRLTGFFDEILVRERITVEGGENNNQSSQFYGPVNFTQKVTNTSDSGIVTKNLSLKGNLSKEKLITVGVGTTSEEVSNELTVVTKTGDIVFQLEPKTHVGFVKDKTEWKKFGLVSQTKDKLDMRVDSLGIAVTSLGNYGETLYVGGKAVFEETLFTGATVFESDVVLNDVRFNDIRVKRTAYFNPDFDNDPNTGIADTAYTQIHTYGTSLFKDIDVVGVSTIRGFVDFKENIVGIGATFGNIRIGVTTDNLLNTTSGGLIIDSSGGTVTVNDNLNVANGDLKVITGTAFTLGITTSRIVDSNKLQIGISTVGSSGTAYVQLFDREAVGLNIYRNNVGTGNSTSIIDHFGESDFIISTKNSSDLKLATNDIERLRVGKTGIITSYNTNSGTELKGAHFSLTQLGQGDVVYSWFSNFNNNRQRWYAGIDASDSHSWKLAYTRSTVALGSENFDTANETKIRVDKNGVVSIAGTVNINGGSTDTEAYLYTDKQTFNLLPTNALTVRIADAATDIGIGSDGSTATVTIRSNKDSSSTSTGALVVQGGVGIDNNLNIGGDLTIGGSDLKSSTTTFNLLNEFVDTASILGEGENITFGAATNTSNTVFRSTREAYSSVDASVEFSGGVGIAKSVHVGNKVVVGEGIIPSIDSGAYLGTVENSFSQLNVDNISIDLNTISSTNTNGNIIIDPNGNGDFVFKGGAGQLFNITDNDSNIKASIDSDTGNITFAGTLELSSSLKLNGSTSGSITISAPAVAGTRALTLPLNNGTIALTSQTDGTITLGTDTNGNYVADITAGAGLSKDTSAGEGQSPTLNIGAGSGITVNADDIQIRNAGSLTNNVLSKWNTSGNQFVNSTITDTGSNVTINSAVTISSDLTLGNMQFSSAASMSIVDNNSSSLVIKEGTNSYITLDTTNSSEKITLHKSTIISTNTIYNGTTGSITVQAPSAAGTNTLTLPAATATIARTSQSDGTITLGTDTNGNYVADITAGAGLTKSGSSGEGWSPTLDVGAGTGISVNADDIQLRNAGSFSNDFILKWNSSSGQLTNSSISDTGSIISTTSKISTTNSTSSTSSTTGALVVSGGIGVGENINSAGNLKFDKIYRTNIAPKRGIQGSINYDPDNLAFYGYDWRLIGSTKYTAPNPPVGAIYQPYLEIATSNTDGNTSGAGTLPIYIRSYSSDVNGSFATITNEMILMDNFGDTTLSRNLFFKGSTSGTIYISAPAVAGTRTLTLPLNNGTIALTSQTDGTITLGTDTNGNYVADITAGAGLTKSGSSGEGWSPTLDIGQGDGITVSADSISVDTTVVRTSRTITAGNGLTDGGALSSNITLNVGQGDGITVSADSISVDTTVVRTSRTITAGNGLTNGGALSSNVTLDVGAGTGISVNADDIQLKNAGSLTNDYVLKWNSSSGQLTNSSITDDATSVSFDTRGIKIAGTSSGYGWIKPDPGIVGYYNNTYYLPSNASASYIALTSQSNGSITLGTDTNGNYVADITAGAGLTKSGSSGEGWSPTLNVGAGSGISVNADDIQLKNAGSFTNNYVLKWNGTSNQLTNSIITDDGSAVQVSGTLNVTGDVVVFYSSDERLKDNITPIEGALDRLEKLSGVLFNWNENAKGRDTSTRHSGVIAQEVREVLPEAVVERNDGYLGVDYNGLIPLIIEAIKELKEEVKSLKNN